MVFRFVVLQMHMRSPFFGASHDMGVFPQGLNYMSSAKSAHTQAYMSLCWSPM